ncbi:hypothetical protein GJ496_006707 [Pomphorhynchus laevis]|nr:hypothetical protein GJ496_006707 [Pomphorhynchus laevis]
MSEDPVKKMYVLVKPGLNKAGRGACPICQNVCMQVFLKIEQNNQLNAEIISLDPNTRHRAGYSITKLPMLIHGDVALTSVDDISEYLDKLIPEDHILTRFNSDANKAQSDVFSRFCFFMKNNSPPDALISELTKLDKYLRNNGSKFLVGDELSAMDCSLLPKLHHIRIVGFTVKSFVIPRKLSALWNYLHSAYEQHCFKVTCPSDQEIIAHWLKDSLIINEMLLLEPTYTMTVTDAGDDDDIQL